MRTVIITNHALQSLLFVYTQHANCTWSIMDAFKESKNFGMLLL